MCGSGIRAVILPLYLALMKSHFKSPHCKKNIEVLERIQRKAIKLEKDLSNSSSEEQLKELGLYSMEKRRVGGDLLASYDTSKGG